ncbi:MAG: DNA (cytosine-5-)-methyltransferase, partial [Clostridia bacterium]
MARKYKVGSLFAGIGGICLGFQNAKIEDAEYELMWANEIDSYACETYRQNFPHDLIEGDINKVLHPEESNDREYYEKMKQKILENEIDILTAGFPCQAFSIAGDRKGFEDERGNLFLSIINLVKQLDSAHKKPRVLFLENVKNLKNHDE